MKQMTWRAPDEVLDRVQAQAAARGHSLNEWVTAVLAAASDPASAGTEAEALRERLARAGLLEVPTVRVRRPPAADVAAARAAAGRGQEAGDIVSEQRG